MGNVGSEPLAGWEHCSNTVLHTSFQSASVTARSTFPKLWLGLRCCPRSLQCQLQQLHTITTMNQAAYPKWTPVFLHCPKAQLTVHSQWTASTFSTPNLRSLPEPYSTQAFNVANLHGPKSKKGIPGLWHKWSLHWGGRGRRIRISRPS